MPFPPSAFGEQAGDEKTRKNLLFQLPEPAFAGFRLLEQRLQELAAVQEGAWRYSSKPSGEHPACLKAKISLDQVPVFDTAVQRTQLPDPWRRLKANAVIDVKGLWMQGKTVGLVVHVVCLQIADDEGPVENCEAYFAPIA